MSIECETGDVCTVPIAIFSVKAAYLGPAVQKTFLSAVIPTPTCDAEMIALRFLLYCMSRYFFFY